MQPVLSGDQAIQLDQLTIQSGKFSGLELMEKAGYSFYKQLSAYLDQNPQPVFIFAGPGNNGGDGLVIARYLIQNNFPTKVFLITPSQKQSPSLAHSFKKLKEILIQKKQQSNLQIISEFQQNLFEEITANGIMIDALFGTGLNKNIHGIFGQVIEFINRIKNEVWAVDIPSGLDATTGKVWGSAIQAQTTITFGYPKRGFYLADGLNLCGKMFIKDIGFDSKILKNFKLDLFLTQKNDFAFYQTKRKPNSHKGKFGHVKIIGGSQNMIGAPILAALASLKAGAGKATVILPQAAFTKIDPQALEVMYFAVGQTTDHFFTKNHVAEVIESLDSKDTLILGPGLGRKPETIEFVIELLEKINQRIVIDADALFALHEHQDIFKKIAPQAILTPHPGEFCSLTKINSQTLFKNRINLLQQFCIQNQITCLLKGYLSLVSDHQGQVFINPTGGPELSSAGQGDVLCGFIAGLWAEFIDEKPITILKLATWLHGAMGDFLSQKKMRVALASQVIEAFDEVNLFTNLD